MTLPRRSSQMTVEHFDRSLGVLTGLSEWKGKPRHLRRADNVLFRPARAMQARSGSKDASFSILTREPTSLGKYYNVAGNRLFVAAKSPDGLSASLERIQQNTITRQTLLNPAGTTFLPSSGKRWSFEMLNGVLIASQEGGSQKPLWHGEDSGADTFRETTFPLPGAMTVPASGIASGSVDNGTHRYRLRWRFKNGGSPATLSAQTVTVSGGNGRVQITGIPTSARADFLGWTLERTKANVPATGRWYWVADGTASTYDDTTADADLFRSTDDGVYAAPPHLDGVIAHKNRLFGWSGSILYFSRPIGGVDDDGSGIFNFDVLEQIPVAKDDGDQIVSCVIQGDRLAIFKRRSIHALEGDDPETFRLATVYDGLGAAGPKCAVSFGAAVYFYAGEGGLFLMAGNKVEPFGWLEVGSYKEEINLDHAAKVVLVNDLGEFLVMFYPSRSSVTPDEYLLYDLRFRVWSHGTDWRAIDAIVQKDSVDFGGAHLLIADPVASPPSGPPSFGQNPSWSFWRDKRAANHQIYGQKLNSAGAAQWTTNGVQISSNVGSALALTAKTCPGLGDSVIVAWTEIRSGSNPDVYVQKGDASGAALWTAGGVRLLDGFGVGSTTAQLVAIVSDGAGGCFVVWTDSRAAPSGTHYRVQKVNSLGVVQWTADGVLVDTKSGSNAAFQAEIVRDGAGGCLIAYLADEPTRTLRGQRFDGAGAIVWAVDGVSIAADATLAGPEIHQDRALRPIFTWTGPQDSAWASRRSLADGSASWASDTNVSVGAAGSAVAIRASACPDGEDGLIVSWVSLDVVGSRYYLYARRVTPSGTLAWGGPTELFSTTNPIHEKLRAVRAVDDGAAIAFSVARAAGDYDVYARAVSGSGTALWTSLASLASFANDQLLAEAITDGDQGMIVYWTDERAGALQDDIFAQRVAKAGAIVWAAGGVAVSTATGEQLGQDAAFTDSDRSGVPAGTEMGFHVWSLFDGEKEYAAPDGSGGRAVRVMMETPPLDEGFPVYLKELRQLQVFTEGFGAIDLTAMILTEGESGEVTIPLEAAGGGSRYDDGDQIYEGPPEAKYPPAAGQTGLYIGAPRQIFESAVPEGVFARRYVLRISGTVAGKRTFTGHSADLLVMPDVRY